MFDSLHFLRNMDFFSSVLRILLACVCGTLIGMERSYRNRPAGIRTHILVCMGSAMAALTGLYLYMALKLPSDISRISSQVITGLGFIAAGPIIVTKQLTIRGLTTASGMWTTGIIGLAIGSGYYEIGVVGTLLVLLTETWFGHLARLIRPTPTYSIEVQYSKKASLDEMLRFCKNSHMNIINLKIITPEKGSGSKHVATVTMSGSTDCEELLLQIRCMTGIAQANLASQTEDE